MTPPAVPSAASSLLQSSAPSTPHLTFPLQIYPRITPYAFPVVEKKFARCRSVVHKGKKPSAPAGVGVKGNGKLSRRSGSGQRVFAGGGADQTEPRVALNSRIIITVAVITTLTEVGGVGWRREGDV